MSILNQKQKQFLKRIFLKYIKKQSGSSDTVRMLSDLF